MVILHQQKHLKRTLKKTWKKYGFYWWCYIYPNHRDKKPGENKEIRSNLLREIYGLQKKEKGPGDSCQSLTQPQTETGEFKNKVRELEKKIQSEKNLVFLKIEFILLIIGFL